MKNNLSKTIKKYMNKLTTVFKGRKTIKGAIKDFLNSVTSNEPLKKKIDKILRSGLWLQPLVMVCVIRFLIKTNPQQLLNIKNWLSLFVLSFLPSLFIWSENLTMPSEEEAMTGKEKAMYPPLAEELLFPTPTGIVLGRDHASSRYVCKPLEEDGHVFLIGGSGSGKSSCLVIPTLLSNPNTRIFALDIKGELTSKLTKYGDNHILIFDPSDQTKYGYDPFYNLSGNSGVQQILETMQNIAYSLIPLPVGLKDPFWKNSARNLLLGLLIYYYRQGTTNFVDIIDKILNKPVQNSIQAVMDHANPESIEYRYIVQFSSMEEVTLGGIVAEMNNHIKGQTLIQKQPSDLEGCFCIYARKA